MACTTIFRGEGGNCNTGLGLGNIGNTTFPGRWTAVPTTVCGRSWLSPSKDGVLHPDWQNYAFYAPTLQVMYVDCGIDDNL